MATYDLFGDTSGLPHTNRTSMPYEIEALSPRELWGAGNGATSLVCRQLWDSSATWIKEMVGEVKVAKQSSSLLLKRYVPEPLQYNLFGDGADSRVQFCSMVDQVEQGGNTSNTNFAQADSNWPQTDWVKYRATWEVFPYAIIDDSLNIGSLPSMVDIAAGAAPYQGAQELYRYVIRQRKTYSREQPIPAASTAGGFKVIDDAVPANRKPIGQVGFRVVGMADVVYKWVRIPIGWPPTIGYLPTDPANPWPPVFNPAAADPTTKKRTRDTFVGTINDDWFDVAAPDGYAWPPGTLLYLGFDDSTRYYDAAGDWVCDVVFTFKAKCSADNAGLIGGWNHYLTAAGAWKEVSLDGLSTGTKPYKTNNFNNLFQWS